MTARRLFCEAVGSAAPAEAIDIVHGTVPRAREAWRSELLAWTEDYYRNGYLPGAPFPTGRTRP